MLLNHCNQIVCQIQQYPRVSLGKVHISRGLWDTVGSGSNLSAQQPAKYAKLIADEVQLWDKNSKMQSTLQLEQTKIRFNTVSPRMHTSQGKAFFLENFAR
jgi:hypothetical protein